MEHLRWCHIAAVASIFLVGAAACAKKETGPGVQSVDEKPWSHAWSGDPEGWWKNWKVEKMDFPVGTRFEFETIYRDGSRRTNAWVIHSVKPAPLGQFEVRLKSINHSTYERAMVPPHLSYGPGPILSRNEKLVRVATPAGTFLAGRLWRSERHGDIPYERDTWVVRDIPLPVQTWSRPVGEEQLYNPPADGIIPPGTFFERLVRIQKP